MSETYVYLKGLDCVSTDSFFRLGSCSGSHREFVLYHRSLVSAYLTGLFLSPSRVVTVGGKTERVVSEKVY